MVMNNNITFINSYIIEREKSVKSIYKPKFHMTPRVGWMNDPNGLIKYDNKYHLYYQANPFASKPGKMLWGHFTSDDLISYNDEGIVLLFEGDGENAFSGGALQIDNDIHIYYTLHTDKREELDRLFDAANDKLEKHPLNEKENEKLKTANKENSLLKIEEVYHAVSIDGGKSFKNYEKVFLNETLPSYLSQIDFRDPCPAKLNDTYYIFVGAKNIITDKGVIVVLKGNTPDKFEYAFEIGPFYELGDMAECPSYYRVGTKDVLVVSGCNVPKLNNSFKNINSSCFIVGSIDFENGKMDVDYIREIDKGDSFYAPQFIRGEDNPVIVGWLEMWGKEYPTHKLGHGWVGTFSIPRVLKEINGEIYQYPVNNFFNYLHEVNGNIIPKQAYISFDFNGIGSVAIKGDNGSFVIGNNSQGVYLDNTLSNSLYAVVRNTDNVYEKAKIEIILDSSALEVFIDNGKEVISSRVYINGELNYEIIGGVKHFEIKEIGGAL